MLGLLLDSGGRGSEFRRSRECKGFGLGWVGAIHIVRWKLQLHGWSLLLSLLWLLLLLLRLLLPQNRIWLLSIITLAKGNRTGLHVDR
jgi:hypothetical protein